MNYRNSDTSFFTMDASLSQKDAMHGELLQDLFRLFDRVKQHWAEVDAQLAADRPLVLLAGTERERFSELEGELSAAEDALRAAILDRGLAEAALREQKEALHPRLLWWRQELHAFAPGTKWVAALPKLPGRAAAVARYREPLLTMRWLWTQLAALEPPLPLLALTAPDGFTLGDFTVAWTELWVADDAAGEAALEVKLARAELRLLEAEAAALLKAYGHAVRSRLREDDPLRRSLPPLWPSRAQPKAQG